MGGWGRVGVEVGDTLAVIFLPCRLRVRVYGIGIIGEPVAVCLFWCRKGVG